MNAREIAEGISEGVNGMAGLIALLRPGANGVPAPPIDAAAVADALMVMDRALSALLMNPTTVHTNLRVNDEELQRIRRLRQLVMALRDEGVCALDMEILAEECLISALNWLRGGPRTQSP